MGYERLCSSCGDRFSTANVRQVRCRKNCRRSTQNVARASVRLAHRFSFVGVDGEGVDRPDGTHEYVMLSVGGRTLFDGGRELSLRQILSFMWECYSEDQQACYVGFFLGYDFNMWFRQLPERQAYLLLTDRGVAERTSQRKMRANRFPDPVVWEGWEVDVMAGRRFKVRPHVHRRSRYGPVCSNRTCGELLGVAGEDGGLVSFASAGSVTSLSELRFARESRRDGWMVVCDTGSFWQTSFLSVIDPKGWGDEGVCSVEEFELVSAGKADRGSVVDRGNVSGFEAMRAYNVLENDILARVSTRLNEGFMNDHIPIRIKRTDWYGPGRAAQVWMDLLHGRIADRGAVEYNRTAGGDSSVRGGEGGNATHSVVSARQNEEGILSLDAYQSMPAWFVDAARSSYYGGWFEQFVHGHCGDVWEYDLNSAYPFIIASLPCLHTTGSHTGRYTRGTGSDHPVVGQVVTDRGNPAQFVLVHATIRGSDPYIGCMPFRTRQGNILRPHRVRGWYWLHEIDAARRAGLVDEVVVDEWVCYTPCVCPAPFNPVDVGIERMYQLRLDVGKNTPAGKALKLVYNSAYGKTAQSVGSPKYANPFYASLITAGCRTLILEAIASHPSRSSGVTMVATDGVYFTSRHTQLSLSKNTLGLWDETFKRNMTQLMPGVYWDDETRQRVADGLNPKMKSRGVNAHDLADQIDRLDDLFARNHFSVAGETGSFVWPSITFKQRFVLTTAKNALHRGRWDHAGRVSHGEVRAISSDPSSKRQPTPYRDESFGGILRTRPYDEAASLDTSPYSKVFGYRDDEPFVDRDGRDPFAYFRELLHG